LALGRSLLLLLLATSISIPVAPSSTLSDPASTARRQVARIARPCVMGSAFRPRCIRFEMEIAMFKQLKPAVPSQPLAVVVLIDLWRIRWIEPRLGSGDWWPLLLP
jgi:hypothetical protein